MCAAISLGEGTPLVSLILNAPLADILRISHHHFASTSNSTVAGRRKLMQAALSST